MKTHCSSIRRPAFTLLETVIAIGVLAVLLTGFMIVFAPAAAGIKRSINVQEADRLATALEQEMVTLREGEESDDIATGFDKAYRMIEDSMKRSSPELIFVYQYRAIPTSTRPDGTLEPYKQKASEGVPGKDYVVVSMARRKVGVNNQSSNALKEDLDALEGRVYAVRVKQLVFSNNQLVVSQKDVIEDPTPGETFDGKQPPLSGAYPEAYIAFVAEFFSVPSSSFTYLEKMDVAKLKTPIFTRNLAVRR